MLTWRTIDDLTFVFARPNVKTSKVSKVIAFVNVLTASPIVILTEMLPREVIVLEHHTLVSDTHAVLDAEVNPVRSFGDRSRVPKFEPLNVQIVSDNFDTWASIGLSKLKLFDNVATCLSIVIVADPKAEPNDIEQAKEESEVQIVWSQADDEIDACRCSPDPGKLWFLRTGPKWLPAKVTLSIPVRGPFDAITCFRFGVAYCSW